MRVMRTNEVSDYCKTLVGWVTFPEYFMHFKWHMVVSLDEATQSYKSVQRSYLVGKELYF